MIDMLADPESFSKLDNPDHSSLVKTSHFGDSWRIEDTFSHKNLCSYHNFVDKYIGTNFKYDKYKY